MVIDKRLGLVRDRTYGMRLYDGETLQGLVSDAGFGNVRSYRDFAAFLGDEDVGFMNHRVMVVAQKTE
jgi:hypothetical protein